MTIAIGLILCVALIAVICAIVWKRLSQLPNYSAPFNFLSPTASTTVLLLVIVALAAAILYKHANP
jgi:hypothetical protein